MRIDVLDKYVNLFISIFYWFLVVCIVVVVGEEFVDFFVDVVVNEYVVKFFVDCFVIFGIKVIE